MGKKLRIQQQNSGFSLVELIIAIAILVIVTGAVCSFIIITSRNYANGNNDISVQQEAQLANIVLNSVQSSLYRKNSYTEFFARAQFIKDFLSRIRYNFSKPGSVSDAKMLRIPLIFGITFFFWTIKGTACQISSFMYHFRPYSLFKVSSSSTL